MKLTNLFRTRRRRPLEPLPVADDVVIPRRFGLPTAPTTKAGRRRANFGGPRGVRNGVRPTLGRRLHDNRGHARTADGLNHNGTPWRGFSARSTRKPWPKPKNNWRAVYRMPILPAGDDS